MKNANQPKQEIHKFNTCISSLTYSSKPYNPKIKDEPNECKYTHNSKHSTLFKCNSKYIQPHTLMKNLLDYDNPNYLQRLGEEEEVDVALQVPIYALKDSVI